MAIVDSFSQPDSVFSLGSAPGVGPWNAAAGIWGLDRHRAYVAGPAADDTNIAVLRLGPGRAAAQVTMAHAVQGAGLVFRYRDPRDYWAVVDVPAYATWSVVKVIHGRTAGAGDTGLSPVGDGTTVAVRLQGAELEILFGTRVVRTLVDPTLDDANMVGMIARGEDAGSARFANFGYTG